MTGRIRALSLIAPLMVASLAGESSAGDEVKERERIVDAQWAYAKSLLTSLGPEALFMFCDMEELADLYKPTREQKAEASWPVVKAYMEAGGKAETTQELFRLRDIFDATETAFNAGYRVGVEAALQFLQVSRPEFCAKVIKDAEKQLRDAAKPETE